MKLAQIAISLIIVSMNCGCVTTYKTSDRKVAVLDIQKRIVTTATMNQKLVTCSEPSPDALSALALQLGVQTPAGVGAQAGLQENAAYIGMRTESIQMLRDLGFRSCEAYQNGAIDRPTYGLLMRRYEKLTALLVALERIGSTASTQEVSLSPQVTLQPVTPAATAARNLVDGALSNVDGLIKSATTPEAKTNLLSLKNDLSQVQERISGLAKIATRANATANAALGNQTPGSTRSQGSPAGKSGGNMTASNNRVSSDSQLMTAVLAGTLQDVVTADDLGEECVGLIKGTQNDNDSNTKNDETLKRICLSYFRVQLVARANQVVCSSDEVYALLAPVLELDPKVESKMLPAAGHGGWTRSDCSKNGPPGVTGGNTGTLKSLPSNIKPDPNGKTNTYTWYRKLPS